jgi:DNA-binding response OmpR family regulator
MFLTARDAVSDRVIGLNAGADDYLCKPFAFEELLARVRSLTRRHDVQPSTILTFDDLQIDMANQRVDRNGHRIDLTSKEYVLLTLFIRRHGQVLSRNDIYEQVWQEPYDGISNTLEVHIKELRRKLESQGKRLIYTIRGQGYKLEAHSETA